MAISVPPMPKGVRPVTGDHLAPIALSAGTRRRREVANYAAVLGRRIAPAPRLPEHPAYPKLFVVGCPRSGTSWVQAIVSAQPRVISSSESHAYETIFDGTVNRGGSRVDAWAKVLHRHD